MSLIRINALADSKHCNRNDGVGYTSISSRNCNSVLSMQLLSDGSDKSASSPPLLTSSDGPEVTATDSTTALATTTGRRSVVLKLLLFGQLISLLQCGTGVFSQLLSDENVQIPTAQNAANYALLCIVFIPWLSYRGELISCLRARWWRYALIAIIDVEANYCTVLAYQYTTLTSVQLLDCAGIPLVMVLSLALLGTRYALTHYGGATVCLGGLALVIWADASVQARPDNPAPNPPLGDGLCVVGAVLYAFSNVAEEFAVKRFSKVEFLAMLGLFGALVSGIQTAVVERDALRNTMLSPAAWGGMVGYALCLFGMYALVPLLVANSSAALLNLSLLTADVYSLLIGLALFHLRFSPLYLAGFSVVLAGVIVVTWRGETRKEDGEEERVPRSGSRTRGCCAFSSRGSGSTISVYQRLETSDDAGEGALVQGTLQQQA